MTNLFAGHPYRFNIQLIINIVVFLALFIPLWQLGYLAQILANDILLWVFVLFMSWKFAKAYFNIRSQASILDKEKPAQVELSNAFKVDVRDYATVNQKIAHFLSGEMLSSTYNGTGLQRFVKDLERSIMAVPNQPLVNLDEYYADYYESFMAEAAPSMREARDQTLYGFIGTVLGMVLGLGAIAIDAIKSADTAAAVSAGVMSGTGIALITTLFGLIYSVHLKRQNDAMRTAFDRVARRNWREVLMISRILRDKDRFAAIVKLNQSKWLPQEPSEVDQNDQ